MWTGAVGAYPVGPTSGKVQRSERVAGENSVIEVLTARVDRALETDVEPLASGREVHARPPRAVPGRAGHGRSRL